MKIASLAFGVFLICWALHDFHASLSEVKQNSKEMVYEVSLRVFTDDLEAALSLQTGTKFKLNSAPEMELALTSYLSKNWMLKLNGKSVGAHYLGKEFDQDVCYLYFEFPFEKVNDKVEIKNIVLLELFDDQTNLLNLQRSGGRRTVVFDRNLQEAAFD
jgi:hypothetical protein